MAYPTTFHYSKEHQWIDVKGDMGTIGLTDYAQSQLNEIVSVDLPKPGAMLEAGKPLGSVESVKTVNEIDAPVSGEVVEVNAALRDAPEKINSDPHGHGWLIKVVRFLSGSEKAGIELVHCPPISASGFFASDPKGHSDRNANVSNSEGGVQLRNFPRATENRKWLAAIRG